MLLNVAKKVLFLSCFMFHVAYSTLAQDTLAVKKPMVLISAGPMGMSTTSSSSDGRVGGIGIRFDFFLKNILIGADVDMTQGKIKDEDITITNKILLYTLSLKFYLNNNKKTGYVGFHGNFYDIMAKVEDKVEILEEVHYTNNGVSISIGTMQRLSKNLVLSPYGFVGIAWHPDVIGTATVLGAGIKIGPVFY